MSEKTVTITKRQYRKICDAMINTQNMMHQMLAICTDGKSHSETALHNAMEMRQAIEQQLREALNVR